MRRELDLEELDLGLGRGRRLSSSRKPRNRALGSDTVPLRSLHRRYRLRPRQQRLREPAGVFILVQRLYHAVIEAKEVLRQPLRGRGDQRDRGGGGAGEDVLAEAGNERGVACRGLFKLF
jgi:hypothetical protein